MAHPPKEAYELPDAEKRGLIHLIQQGKALPEKYRFILFEDKRAVALVWNGKNREVCTTVLPFQSLEHVDEPRQEKSELGTLDLFDPRGREGHRYLRQRHPGPGACEYWIATAPGT